MFIKYCDFIHVARKQTPRTLIVVRTEARVRILKGSSPVPLFHQRCVFACTEDGSPDLKRTAVDDFRKRHYPMLCISETDALGN